MKKQFISIAVVLFLSTVFSFVLFKTSVTEFMRNDLLPNPYNNWEEELEYGETTGANEWARQENSMIMDPNTGEIPVHLAYEEYKRILYQRGVDPSQIYWQERGPYNVGGRTRAVMFDPNDPIHRKLWAGGVTGGLWYNDNPQGPFSEWKQVSDLWENLVISCIAYDPTNTQIFYVGTGEGWFKDYYGIPGLGIWKSVNGGVSWEHLNSTYTNNDFRHVQKIVVHPANGYVYAATRSNGVMRSTDGGVSWNPVLNTSPPNPSLSNRAADLEITANGEILAAMGFWDQGDGVYISSTGNPGDWTRLNDGSNIFPTAASGIRRIELAVAPFNADIIYAVVQDNGNINRTTVYDSDIQGIYKSTDKGITWVSKTIPILRICADGQCGDDVGNDGDTIFFSATQTLYDLAIAVDPNNPEVLLVGGVSLHLSTDGGDHWSKIEGIHDDHHAIVFHPEEDDLVFNGTDGGVYSVSLDPILVHDNNEGYRVTQFHGCALHPVWGVDYILGGAQDNGSWKFDSPGMNDTKFCIGGDGGYCYIFRNHPSYQIVSTQYDRFFLSTDNGAPFESIYESGVTADLISPWDYDESTNTIYAAYDERNIFILNNATTEPVVYHTCYSAKVGHNNLFYNKATAFKVSPYVDSELFVGTFKGELYKITNAFDTLNCVIDSLTGPFQGNDQRLNCIEFGSSENQIIVVFSNYGITSVWETLDGGLHWNDKEGDLPNIPVYWAIYNPLDNRQVLLATELGVYTTEDISVLSPHWVPVNNGLPIIRTTMLKVRESDNLVIASTYGRGIYSTSSFFVSPSTKILASDGEEGDAFGNSVATNGDFAIVGANEEDQQGENAGAVYFFEQLNNQWTESAKVLAADGTAGDHFGRSVDMHGDIAIVGADGNDGSGSAYIYRYSGSGWIFEEKISPNDGLGNNKFGYSVAIMNEVAVIGAPGTTDYGAVYIFNYQSGNWIQTDKIIPENGTIAEQFGWAIDFDGTYIIVGSPWGNSFTGSACIYKYDNGWVLDKKITADDANDGDRFGISVGLDHQYAVVGAYMADGKPGILDPGAAYVFYTSVSSIWEQTAKLWAPDAWTFQRFGQSVSIYEDYIMVGAPLDYELDFPAGAAYVYKRESSTNWLRQNKLFASNGESGVWFGSAINLYGTAAIVASIFDNDNGAGSGSAYIFNNIVNATNLPILSVTPPSVNTTSAQNTTTIQINNNGPGDMNWVASSFDPWLQFVGDSSGTNSGTITVNVNENLYCPRNGRIIVRAPGALHSPREVFIHQQPGSNSNEVNITPPDLNAYDQFGRSADVDGECAIVGAPQDSEFEQYSGAAYIFERDGCCSWVQKAKLHQSNPEDHDRFGWSVALSGDVALVSKWRVGFVAYIFEKPSGGWQDMTETAKLIYSLGGYTLGISVDISGESAIIGVPDQRSIYIFERPPGGWVDMTETFHYLLSFPGALGESVAIEGNYAVAGNTNDISHAGAAYIFKYDWNWGYQARITPSDGLQDWFGQSVDIDRERIIVGSRGNAAAYIYVRENETWIEEQKLTPPPGGSHFASGIECVSIDGQYALVGAYDNLDTLYRSGSAFSFIRNDLGWSFSKQIFSSDIHEEDRFGASVCVSGPYTIIGAYHKENSLGSQAGAAYIYCTEGDIVTSLSTPPEQTLPVSYDLKQNYPNPFNPVTTIVFDLPKPTNVTLKIYTILGEEVTTLVSEELKAGTHKYIWDPVSLASGVYLYRIESKEFTVTKKMVFLK